MPPVAPVAADRPLRILWYWPHPHRGDGGLMESTLLAGDTLTVECLSSYRGEPLHDLGETHVKIRDLPDVRHGRLDPARRLANRSAVHLVRAWRRRRLATSGAFDVLHVENVSLLDGLPLIGIPRTIPTVLVVHDVEPHKQVLPRPVQRAMLRRAFLRCTRLIAYHDTIRAQLAATYGLDPATIDVVPHPVADVPPAHAIPIRDGAPLRLLAFGSLRANKGIDVLLDAAHRLPPDGVSIVIAGAGDAALEAAACDAAEAIPSVRAEIGYVTDQRRDELFREADVVVLPYRETFGSQSGVLLDAYAFGLPVIVSDVGAIGPTVRDDGTGWVIPPGDAGALVAAVQEAIDRPDLRREMAGRIAAVRGRYDVKSVGPLRRASYGRAVADRG